MGARGLFVILAVAACGGDHPEATCQPTDDQNPCTIEGCADGMSTVDFAPAQTACGSGLSCDGAGHCVQCTSASQCPGTDDECQMRGCASGGMCDFTFATSGTPRTQQAAGDCQREVCDGAGGTSSMVDDSDIPVDDGNACTSEVCTLGIPAHTNLAIGTACGSGLECDGDANCVACLADNECPGTGNECALPACLTGGICGTTFAPTGTVLSTQAPGDCQKAICDGAGGPTTETDNNDVPGDDGNPCTTEVCIQGSPAVTFLPTGTNCGNGLQCDGIGNCVACVFDTDCPATGNECAIPACFSGGVCGTTFAPNGTPLSTQAPGDCKTAICDGAGTPTFGNDDQDVPADDGNPCTSEACSGGNPVHVPLPEGTSCGGGRTCSSGVCN